MNKQFADRLEAYLSSEINDYGLTYSWEWCEDTGCCVVKIERDYMPKRGMYVNFKWNGLRTMKNLLLIGIPPRAKTSAQLAAMPVSNAEDFRLWGFIFGGY